MSNPDEVRRDIERTRAELSSNVNALTDSAKPSNIARSQVEKVKEGAVNLKESIFGSDDNPSDDGKVGEVRDQAGNLIEDARDQVANAAGDVRDRAVGLVDDAQSAVADAPRQIRRGTRGNPLSAGLIALGLGALVGGMLPSTKAEKRYANELKDKAQPLMEEAKSMAQDAAEQIKPLAAEAVDTLKDKAAEAAGTVKTEATDAAALVADQAKASAETVKSDAQVHVDDTKDEAKFATETVKDTAKDASERNQQGKAF